MKRRPMARYRDAKELNKAQFIRSLFRCSEAYGFRPSIRTMEALLADHYGVRLRRETLLRILSPFLSTARRGYHPEAEAGNGFPSSGKRNGNLGNTSPISGNGFPSSGKHLEENGKHLSYCLPFVRNSTERLPIANPPSGPLTEKLARAKAQLAEIQRRNAAEGEGEA
jgi:hypothetical protein